MSELGSPTLGFGLGLRPVHYEALLGEHLHAVDWLEVLSENYFIGGGPPLRNLGRIREHYPLVMHGVSLSIGGTDPLDRSHLKNLRALADTLEVHWVSDHLCWTGTNDLNLHDLLPLPYTEETLRHVTARIEEVQERLGRRVLIENVSSYLSYRQSEMSEWEFIRELVARADCMLLLDINNIYVSSVNHAFDPLEYLRAVPIERVQQMHLAGHSKVGDYLIDTHDHPIIEPVWALYRAAVERFGNVSTMIERDDDIPPLDTLLTELERARSISRAALAKAA
jgi:uncharacterized protein (UPF0276 family)